MSFLYGISACFIAFAAAGLYRLIVVRRIRVELGAFATEWNSSFVELLKEHKSRFAVSRTRTLSNALMAAQMVAAAAALALIVAAQSQPHSLLHLIPAGR
jgi:hypothetical protein